MAVLLQAGRELGLKATEISTTTEESYVCTGCNVCFLENSLALRSTKVILHGKEVLYYSHISC